MQLGKEIEDLMNYYILQPFHVQAVTIAKFIRANKEHRVIAVLLKNEIYNSNSIYDETIVVDNYSQIPLGSGFIVPTGASSTEVILSFGDLKLNNINMIQKNLLVFDKVAFLDFCRSNDLPVPRQYEYKELRESNFPIFYKEKLEQGGGIRGRADSFKDLTNVPKKGLIFQELINSQGTYGVAFLAKGNKLITSLSHFEAESYPVSGGSATVLEIIEDKRLIELTEKFVESFGYEGWGLAEYKYCPIRQDYVFMEINAKFWASCSFSFLNNPEFIRELFNINITKKETKSLIYLNRLLNTGILNTFRVIIKYRNAKIIVESSIYRSIFKAFLITLGFNKVFKRF